MEESYWWLSVVHYVTLHYSKMCDVGTVYGLFVLGVAVVAMQNEGLEPRKINMIRI